MTLLSDDTVRALAGFRSEAAPVTTCYLDVDGRRLPAPGDIQREFQGLVRRAGLNGNGSGHAPSSVTDDVKRMEQYVKGLTRGGTRGLAMFSCSAQGFWEAHELPVRVTSQLVVEPVPSVRQLEAVLEEYERIGVLLVDRQRARLYVFELGELVDHTEQLDRLERHGGDDRGELVKTRVAQQVSEQVHQHLRRAAQLAFEVFQRDGFGHLVLGAPSDLVQEMEHLLHPYLRERLAERAHLPVSATADQIRACALGVEQRVERRREAMLVQRLRDAMGSRAKAVVGLAPTLRALGERRVDRLMVSAGYQAEGWRCPGCGTLAAVGRACTACGTAMELVPDVVEAAVAEALGQHCRVDVFVSNADLDVLGRVGALLRY